MRRLLFHLAAAVSLLVAMVIVFFGLRAHWIADYFLLPEQVEVRTTRSGWQVSQFDARSYYGWPPPTTHGTLPRGIDDADQPLWESERYKNGDVQLRFLGFRFWRITADKWVGSQRQGGRVYQLGPDHSALGAADAGEHSSHPMVAAMAAEGAGHVRQVWL